MRVLEEPTKNSRVLALVQGMRTHMPLASSCNILGPLRGIILDFFLLGSS